MIWSRLHNVLVLMSLYSLLSAQRPQPMFFNYNTEHGLPSSEVHEIFQDREGYIWIGTDNGLSRFDGYEFTNFSAAEGLVDPMIVDIVEDKQDKIWVLSMSGKIFIEQGESFVPFEGNDLIASYKNFYIADEFCFSSHSDSIHINLKNLGLLDIDIKQLTASLRDSSTRGVHFYDDVNHALGVKISDAQYHGNFIPPLTLHEKNKHTTFLLDSIFSKPGPGRGINSRRLEFKNEVFYTYIVHDQCYLLNSAGLLKVVPNYGELTSHLIYGDQIWCSAGSYGGFSIIDQMSDLSDQLLGQYLIDSHVTDFFEDRQSAVWISTLEDGLYYLPSPNNQYWNKESGLNSHNIKSVAIASDSSVWITNWSGNFQELDFKHQLILKEVAHSTLHKYNFDAHYDPIKDQLIGSSSPIIDYFIENNGHDIRKFSSTVNNRNILYITPSSLFQLSLDSLTTNKYVATNEFTRTFDVGYDQNGQIWVGTTEGLFQLKQDSLLRPDNLDSLLHYRLEAIEFLSDNRMVCGTKGNGILVGHEKGKTTQISTQQGLSSNNIENIHIDEEDRIWIGTLNGLNVVKLHQDSFSVKHFKTEHGLPSNEISKVLTQADFAWVATAKGLLKLEEQAVHQQTFTPIITKVTANGKEQNIHQEIVLKPQDNNVEIHFVALDYMARGNIRYRYRLQPTDDWKYTKQTKLTFPKLPPNQYDMELQAENIDHIWSTTNRIQIEIDAPWWKKGWFSLLCILLSLGFIYLFYRRRIKSIEDKTNIQSQIIELERSALQAQMNPHFIFNILNTIQAAISQQDTDKAMDLLAKFAKLIRKTLNNATQKSIRLYEEVEYLKSYMHMEQMRFNHTFDYRIDVDENINTFDIHIPPMLCQPFIENAIKHGLCNLEKGLLEIKFEWHNDEVFVQIKDNGAGLQDLPAKSDHQSLALSITKRRLELMGNKNAFKLYELRNEQGEIEGTCVEFMLKAAWLHNETNSILHGYKKN